MVVADVPPRYGMLLSRTYSKRIGGTIQMDMKYETIPLFVGETRRLHREERYAYVLSEGSSHINYPIYIVEDAMGSCMLYGGSDYDKDVYPLIHMNDVKHT